MHYMILFILIVENWTVHGLRDPHWLEVQRRRETAATQDILWTFEEPDHVHFRFRGHPCGGRRNKASSSLLI